jgi:hypothetical protein
MPNRKKETSQPLEQDEQWLEEDGIKFRLTSGRVEIVKQVGEVLHLAISFQTKDRYWHQLKVKINRKHFKQM